jgi:long-chain acyl-CoA synthetase
MPATDVRLNTFSQLLLQQVAQRPQASAIREKSRGIWRTLTWQALADDAANLAAGLAARGLQRGAFVAVLGDNRPQLFSAVCAAHALGAVVLPLYPDASAAELLPALQNAKPTHVFAENQQQVDKLLDVLAQCPFIQCIVYDEDRGMRHYAQRQLVSHSQLAQEGQAQRAQQANYLQTQADLGQGSDAAFLFFTSGASGPAKAVLMSHQAFMGRAQAAVQAENISSADVTLAYLPPGWIGQMFFSYAQALVAGYTVCCPESAESMLADMREVGPTYVLLPPRVLKALLTQINMRMQDASKLNQALYRHYNRIAQRVGPALLAGGSIGLADRLAYGLGDLLVYGPLRDVLGLSKVRVAYTAGDGVDDALIQPMRCLGINLKPLYGCTEAGFYVASPGQASAATSGLELKLAANNEICVRAPGLYTAYHGDAPATPQARVQAQDTEGWLHTGDVGSLAANGQLQVTDRLASMGQLRSGAAFTPSPIERKLRVATIVREAVALGTGQEQVCALIDIDNAAVSQLADKASLSFTGHAELASLDAVRGWVTAAINQVNAQLALDPALAHQQIHRFAVLQQDLNADDGLLTRTGTLRRQAIGERYAELIDAMAQGHQSVPGADPHLPIVIGQATVLGAAAQRKAA